MASHLKSVFDSQKEHFLSDRTKSYAWRYEQLERLERMLRENRRALADALGRDFKTAWFEQTMELQATLSAIDRAKQNLATWMEPEDATPAGWLTDTCHRTAPHREPYGVCLIIAPSNAPISLTLEPLIAAVSAGNTAVVKPAESTTALNSIYQELFARYFESHAVALTRSDHDSVTELLGFPFDFIFFTGSAEVGKVIMRAAAENRTPVLLELGGHNPVVVDSTADLHDAAEKVVWGTMAFGGQWFVSPSYVYVHDSVAETFVEACKTVVIKLHGEDAKNSPDFSRINTQQEVNRVAALPDGAPSIAGGAVGRIERYVAPTIIFPACWTDAITKAEISGPVLPILTYSDLDEVIEMVNLRPKSLAAYFFSRDEALVNRFVHTSLVGGGAANQTVVHCLVSMLPFGGVGPSGFGRYHGKYGFDLLSHTKSVLYFPAAASSDSLVPLYTDQKAWKLDDWFAGPSYDR